MRTGLPGPAILWVQLPPSSLFTMTKRIHPEPERMPTRLAVALRLYMKEHGIRMKDIEEHTGIRTAVLSRFLSGYYMLSTHNYMKLQSYLTDYHSL